jgi:hypothetical protein
MAAGQAQADGGGGDEVERRVDFCGLREEKEAARAPAEEAVEEIKRRRAGEIGGERGGGGGREWRKKGSRLRAG